MRVVGVHDMDHAELADGDHDSGSALAAVSGSGTPILLVPAPGVAKEDRNQKHETRGRQRKSERPAQLGAAVLWEDHHAAYEAHQTCYHKYITTHVLKGVY